MEAAQLLEAFDRATGVSTDTRTLKAGELYFALRGPNFDGNQYAEAALIAGASAVVVDDRAMAGRTGHIVVEDTLLALQVLAKAYRQRLTCPVVGLTGSNGKTTTKELLAAVLQQSYEVSFTAGNLNNHIGVPLTLLRIPASAEIAIVEMGANHQGEIAALAEIAAPTHGLITNIGRAHLEGFGGIEGVRIGKGELFDYLRASGGRGFVDVADEEVSSIGKRLGVKLAYSSVSPSAGDHLILSCVQREAYPYSSGEILAGGKSVDYESNLPGAHNHRNISAAAALGYYFKVPLAKIAAGISAYRPANSRSEERRVGESVVLLDAYNANPDSTLAGLRWLSSRPEPKKVAVLGTLAELGAYAKTAHAEIAAAARQVSSEVIFFGDAWLEVAETEAVLTEVETLREVLAAHYADGETVILIKGSRSNRLERVLPGEP